MRLMPRPVQRTTRAIMKSNPKNRNITALAAVAGGLVLATGVAGAQGVVYQDEFDGDGLADNAGVGGGLGSFDRQGGPWLDSAGGVLDANRASGNNNRGNVHTLADFDLSGGFALEVTYSTSQVTSGRVNFGVIDSAGIPAVQDSSNYVTDYLSNDRGQYGIGMDLTAHDGNQGLAMADGTGVTSLSNAQPVAAGTQTVLLIVDSDSNWSYSIDGAVATSGTLAVPFDFTRDYKFFAFAQSLTNIEPNAPNDFMIDRVVLTVPPPDDTSAPTPDPMSWASAPEGISEDEIRMTATVATDIKNGVEYRFYNMTDPTHDSGWQASPSYTDSGLAAGTRYEYIVVARDTSVNLNETAASPVASASTLVEDRIAPTPDPMTWASAPAAVSPYAVGMSAASASDPKGVEYYFSNLTDPDHDSGWQDSPDYIDSGLLPDTSYSYTVKARDKSQARNETAESAPVVSASTDVYTGDDLFADSFDRDDSSSSDGGTLAESALGMSGSLGGLSWSGKVFPQTTNPGTSTVLDINGGAMRMDLYGTEGMEGGLAYISDHNFVDVAIKAAGAFTVSVDLNSAESSGTGRVPGFGVGQSLDDLEGMTGAHPEMGSADVFIGYDRFGATQGIAVYHGAELVGYTGFPSTHTGVPTNLTAWFWFADMNAGSTLNYEVLLDGESVVTGATSWSGSDENFISLQSNTTGETRFDNFAVRAVSQFEDDYSAWVARYPGADLSDPEGDFDGDGVSNEVERLFGLDPGDSSSLSPYVEPFDPVSGTFSFSRRDDALTELHASVEVSRDLRNWATDGGAVLVAGDPDVSGVEIVDVQLSAGLLEDPELFVRVALGDPPPPVLGNGSFEDPEVPDNGVEALGVPWTFYDPADVASTASGTADIYNPPFEEYPGEAPDGANVLSVLFSGAIPNTAFGCSQVLGESFAADTDYRVSVEVGRATFFDWPGYGVQLWAGATLLAEDANSLTPAAGTFETSTVHYVYDPADAGLAGEPLEIRLLNLGGDPERAGSSGLGFTVDFDAVSFSSEPSAN